ncbi:hypothetical protein CVU76_02080 [Candidatus Dojkabacteria bacterium HGW-Dojkabacteria-1]|uniref:Uncharacterized protein n=1 Tax=Candidatus Dojkabacteria bacterium HGW-Dojkabacteria-1 TaxID=2013761 RepID=A0A2N2F3R2_9BACT|nr:MAG: hypothetical protein CVU76_02080 [Candidatus Dojkabacteria bacterium HGW-Dojkabacteria-1]
MKLIKGKKKSASPVIMPKIKNNRPQIVKRKRKFQFPKLFEKNKYGNRRKVQINLKILVLPVLAILFLGFVYISIRYVTFMRSSAVNEENYIVGDVVGLENIPEYPGTEFIFKNNLEDSVVKEFLSGGNSAYRLLVRASIEDIEEYYKEILSGKGWELVAEIPLGTEDKKYGQYWVKDGKGLRIYSKFKDIWYETITEEEAKTALANRVQDEIEREMLMASSEKQDLLPDYPWKIQIPKEYIIKYSATDNKDLRAVSFQKLGSNDIIEIYPLSKIGSKELDFMLNDYCKIKSTEEIKYSVMNTIPTGFRDYLSLRGNIVSNDKNMEIIMLPNSFNGIVYVMSSTKQNDPLFGYILENIKPMGSKD